MVLVVFILILGLSTGTSGDFSSNAIKKEDTITDKIKTNQSGKGQEIMLNFTGGKHFSHAVFAFWIEKTDGSFVQTLYVSESVGKGYFDRTKATDHGWEPGPNQRPATLPYWAHKRTEEKQSEMPFPDAKHPVPDAYTGATPLNNFTLTTRLDEKIQEPFRVLMEVNQAFDFNENWTNSMHIDDEDYQTSGQPSLVYAVTVYPGQDTEDYWLNPIGHGHYSGQDGKLYTNLTSLSTALEIVKTVQLVIKN
ncbi:MAG: hypothetical protein C0594_14200 [Marinilabiliales bacterium]|nr:MAG: hypothetical protein C0594_14200 [Marinilabiliales bacterium]